MLDDVTEWKSDRISQKVAGRRLYGMIYEIPLIVMARLEEAVAAPRAGPAAGRRVAAQAPSASASGFAEASAAQVHHLTDSF